MDIGFIGLGAMGTGIVGNLVRAGHNVRVWNRSPGPVEAAAKLGAHPVPTPRDAFAGDAVLSMLADDAAVRAVIMAPGLVEQAPRGLVHANLATISVALTRELEALHEAHNLGYVAAPVFGRPEVASAGQLQIVCAGQPDSVARVEPLLDAFSRKTWPVGREAHRAAVVKLAGNFLIASAIEGLAEAAALGERNGVPAAALLDVLTNAVFTAPVYQNYAKLIAERRYMPAGFKLALGLKDVRLVLAAGEAVAAPLPLASVLRDSLLEAMAHGQSDHDWSALAEVSRRRAGLWEGESQPESGTPA